MTTAPTTTRRTRVADPVLAEVKLRKARRAEADLALIVSIVDWAAAHEVAADSIDAACLSPFDGTDLALAGPGAPRVDEFALYELATALGRTIDSTKVYVGQILEVRYRLPRSWARVAAGDLSPFRAFRIAEHTYELSQAGAAHVDRMLAPCAGTLSNAQLERTVADSLARFDPELAEARAAKAAEKRHVRIDLSRHGLAGLDLVEGTVTMEATLDAADALDLEHAIQGVADQLRALGSTESRDVRRSMAVGEIARAQLALDLARDDQGAGRGVTIYAHVHPDSPLADLDTPGLAGPVHLDRIRDWCQQAGTTVRVLPLVDLEATLESRGYVPSARLRQQVELRDRHCVAPYCTRPARSCDLDHVVPHARGGPTSSDNLAPLCRRHHRVKTHHPAGPTTRSDPGPSTGPPPPA